MLLLLLLRDCLLVAEVLLSGELLLNSFDRQERHALVLALDVALHESLGVDTGRQQTLLGQHHDLLLLLALLDKVIIAAFCLSARIFRLYILLKFFLVDNIFIRNDTICIISCRLSLHLSLNIVRGCPA